MPGTNGGRTEAEISRSSHGSSTRLYGRTCTSRHTAILLPATGIALVQLYGFPLTTPWIIAAIIAFVLTGALWLPAVWLQVQMRTLADSALAEGTELSPTFHRYHRYWVALGVPAFALAMFVVWIMVAKRI